MNSLSRRSFIALGGFWLSAISGTTLVGCSGTSENIQDSEDDTYKDDDGAKSQVDSGNFWDSASGDISPSVAFKQKGIWYSYGNDYDSATFGSSTTSSIGKDEAITGIHIFHGDGTATSWFVYDSSGVNRLTFSDIDDLTDDEVEDLCPKYWSFDSDAFENEKQDFISYFNSCSQEDGVDYSSVISKAELLNAPREPSAEAYSLKVSTDDSGNSTNSETLTLHRFKSPSAFTSNGRSMLRQYVSSGYIESHPGVLDSMFDTNEKWPFQLTEHSEPKMVYETTYSGYEHIVLKYDGIADFVLDEPNSADVEVD